MSIRKTVLLREIISYFATPMQIKRYDELAGINKGSSTAFALRLIQGYFEKKSQTASVTTTTQEDKPATTGRTLKINAYGKSWLENF